MVKLSAVSPVSLGCIDVAPVVIVIVCKSAFLAIITVRIGDILPGSRFCIGHTELRRDALSERLVILPAKSVVFFFGFIVNLRHDRVEPAVWNDAIVLRRSTGLCGIPCHLALASSPLTAWAFVAVIL